MSPTTSLLWSSMRLATVPPSDTASVLTAELDSKVPNSTDRSPIRSSQTIVIAGVAAGVGIIAIIVTVAVIVAVIGRRRTSHKLKNLNKR